MAIKLHNSIPSRAIVITPLIPRQFGGAGPVVMAYLQALSELYQGRLIYVGPEFTERLLPSNAIEHKIFIRKRSFFQKFLAVLTLSSIDRLYPYWENHYTKYLDKEVAVYILCSRAGRYARLYRTHGIPVVTVFHNIAEDYVTANPGSWWFQWVRKTIWKKNEEIAYKYSKLKIVFSKIDAEHLNAMYARPGNAEFIPANGYFLPRFSEVTGFIPQHYAPCKQMIVLLTCSLRLEQNRKNVQKFISSIWSTFTTKHLSGSVRLIIAGMSPPEELLCLVQKHPNISVVGDPDVQTMQALAQKAHLYVSTADRGSGIKGRIAHALGDGLPVVSTAHSAIGYEEVDPRVLRVCKTQKDFVQTFQDMAVLQDEEWQKLFTIARSEFDRLFSYDAGKHRLKEWLFSCKLFAKKD